MKYSGLTVASALDADCRKYFSDREKHPFWVVVGYYNCWHVWHCQVLQWIFGEVFVYKFLMSKNKSGKFCDNSHFHHHRRTCLRTLLQHSEPCCDFILSHFVLKINHSKYDRTMRWIREAIKIRQEGRDIMNRDNGPSCCPTSTTTY